MSGNPQATNLPILSPSAGEEDLHAAYLKADGAVRLRHVRISILLFLFLNPTFSALDWIVYPQHFQYLLNIRLIISAVFLGLYVLTYTPLIRFIKTFGAVAALLAGLSISWMIAVSEGAASPYYAGLNLILVVMSVLLPWTLGETAVVCAGTIAIYVAACYRHDPELLSEPESWAIFTNNLFFLAATSLICMTASYFQSVRRFEEFRLSFELDHQNRKLEALDRQKTHFFANISHELRTPLTLILAPVQDLLEGGRHLPDELASRLGIVRDNGLRLLKLVNDLLTVIRMEEGKDRLESVPVEINGLLRGLVDGMTHLADTKTLALEKRLPVRPLVVRGDPRALEKIFVNLLNNAIKFTEKGGRITVESGDVGGHAEVRISDTGIGIPKEELPHIFDRFHQVDGSSTRRYRGTGLGLALVKELSGKMGGDVRVQSRVGMGTTMTVVLPLCDEQDILPAVREEPETDGLEHLHRLADGRGGLAVEEPEADWGLAEGDGEGPPVLLVVEDEPDMRRYLVGLLEGDYRVLQARSGTEGLSLAQGRNPDLVLLDLMLPEMDGLEVCRRIRAGDGGRRQKIMLLTARVDERSKLTALENGADDFLTKPFSSVEVQTRLRNLWATAALERDVHERNRRLAQTLSNLEATQAQLIHSEKLNALGSLAAGLLHEINNPLNYSLTALQLLAAEPGVAGDDLLREVVADIDEGMQRIRVIVSDLRSFAYPSEANKCVAFAIGEALDSALRFTAHELKGIEVSRQLPEGLLVLGSKSNVTQVLVNLLANAARAIEPVAAERPGRIRVLGSRADGRLHIHIEDNGIGMDTETLSRIFDPFFTTRAVGDGMGLGLSICHTIVANHGGRLSAKSRPGDGTRLTFDLPLAQGEGP